jgi:putative transposase
VMKVRGLLLDRHAGGTERRHDGRIAVDERNRHWCSDGFEIGCDNGEKCGLPSRWIAVIGKP